MSQTDYLKIEGTYIINQWSLVLRLVTSGSNVSKVVDRILDMEKSRTFSSQ